MNMWSKLKSWFGAKDWKLEAEQQRCLAETWQRIVDLTDQDFHAERVRAYAEGWNAGWDDCLKEHQWFH